MDVSFTVKGSAPSSRLDTEKTKEVTALQGLVLGCLGAPRGSLEMYPEAGRTEGNLSHCDDPMRLGRRVLGSGYPKPPPTRPQHSSTLQEQGSKSNYFFKKKKKKA